MQIKTDYAANNIPNYIEERDIFGQIKPKKLFVFKRSFHKSKNAPDLNVNYAGFWTRALATLIDLIVVIFVLAILDSMFLNNHFIIDNLNMYRIIIGILAWIFYNGLSDSSVYQATIGKMILKMNVIDLFGKRLSILKASLRCISTIFSILPLGLGFWYITTDPKKQAWHDLISGSYVIKLQNK